MKYTLLLILLFSIMEGRENPFENFPKTVNPFFSTDSLLHLPKSTPKKMTTKLPKKNILVAENVIKPTPKTDHIQKTTFIKEISQKHEQSIHHTDPALTLDELSKKYILIDCCKAKKVTHKSIHKKKSKKRKTYTTYQKKLYSHCNMTIYQYDRIVKLITKDCLKSKIILTHPNRVVFDFYQKAYIRPASFHLKHSNIKKISIASHNSYYRITLYTDKKNIHIKRDRASFILAY